ncbi:MAG: hypothetical protein MUE30_18055, partial [Spirosomaceae bacterium]|nr:hypothetical protein [Spirosomataceae bacterium]
CRRPTVVSCMLACRPHQQIVKHKTRSIGQQRIVLISIIDHVFAQLDVINGFPMIGFNDAVVRDLQERR